VKEILIYLVIGLFVAMLFLNVYFRAKVLKVYKRLVNNEVQFDSSHIFNSAKMEKEVLSKYPSHREDILLFVSHITYSIKIASVLIVLITIAGMILKT